MGIKDKFIEEPRLETVLAWLSDQEGVNSIKQDINKLSNTMYFFKEEQVLSLYQTINKLNDIEYSIILKNLMALYPLSENIVSHILKENKKSASDIIKAYDSGDALVIALNKLINEIKQQAISIPKSIKEYEEKIQKYESEKSKYVQNFDDLKNVQIKHNQLYHEVERLKEEYQELEKSYTKSVLEELKIDIENKLIEKRKMEEQYNKDKQLIKSIVADLEKINSENASYKKALKSLSSVAKTLPDCEVD